MKYWIPTVIAVIVVIVAWSCSGGLMPEQTTQRGTEDVSQAPYIEELDENYEVVTNLEIPGSKLIRVVLKNVVFPSRILVVLDCQAVHPGTRVKVVSVDYMQTSSGNTSILLIK